MLSSTVATALTVYGIETYGAAWLRRKLRVATALTVYGIETKESTLGLRFNTSKVATALTVYGIETGTYGANDSPNLAKCCNSTYRLRY